MPQTVYLGAADLPDQIKKVYTRAGRQWHLKALVIHFDRESGRETGRTAFLSRAEGGGPEWETPWESLLDTAVDQ